jgi:hypothetical protein
MKHLSQLTHNVSEPNIYRGALLSTPLQAILNPSHHLLNVLLQLANKLGFQTETQHNMKHFEK